MNDTFTAADYARQVDLANPDGPTTNSLACVMVNTYTGLTAYVRAKLELTGGGHLDLNDAALTLGIFMQVAMQMPVLPDAMLFTAFHDDPDAAREAAGVVQSLIEPSAPAALSFHVSCVSGDRVWSRHQCTDPECRRATGLEGEPYSRD